MGSVVSPSLLRVMASAPLVTMHVNFACCEAGSDFVRRSATFSFDGTYSGLIFPSWTVGGTLKPSPSITCIRATIDCVLLDHAIGHPSIWMTKPPVLLAFSWSAHDASA
ncbi:unnamed protein product [Vitrella brassicaformis CCMP3155]|uniref:Uncharacterized protein n=1 Tax=Vitrella brassicaformis (strain CCMP3155) TaxID=1169540 RepID=A0A0G4GKZ9_VITBC|nr:unnamed protein product [Vitrella brassicaformis CCMP3155]|eukprot:CEM30709.1 unnamed protein product [Vitrella brassicaformis CCMP3155]